MSDKQQYRLTDEPSPKPGQTLVVSIAQTNFLVTSHDQDDKGRDKYNNEGLMTFDGRDSYADFMQEYVDSVHYATKLHLEYKYIKTLARVVIYSDNEQEVEFAKGKLREVISI